MCPDAELDLIAFYVSACCYPERRARTVLSRGMGSTTNLGYRLETGEAIVSGVAESPRSVCVCAPSLALLVVHFPNVLVLSTALLLFPEVPVSNFNRMLF